MRFHEMTWPELRRVSRDKTLVVAPIGSCEQHGPHLPTFTDTLLVTAVAEGVERQLPQQVLLLPTLWLGASEHHLRFGATLTATVETHVTILCELIAPLLNDGYQRILILNGHGGNVDTMQLALRRLQTQYPDRLLTGGTYCKLVEKELALLHKGPRKTVLHADELETAMMLAIRPDLVRRDEVHDSAFAEDPALRGLYVATDMKQLTETGVTGYPTFAATETGQAMLAAAVKGIAEIVQELLQRSTCWQT